MAVISFVVTRSGISSPLTSAIPIEPGNSPVGYGCAGWRTPVPSFSKTLTECEKRHGTATSSLPSPFTSPMATSFGVEPTV
jgi:hypothetical protein